MKIGRIIPSSCRRRFCLCTFPSGGRRPTVKTSHSDNRIPSEVTWSVRCFEGFRGLARVHAICQVDVPLSEPPGCSDDKLNVIQCSKNVSEAEVDPNELLVSVKAIARGRAAAVRMHVANVWPTCALQHRPPQSQGRSAPNASTHATITPCLLHVSI